MNKYIDTDKLITIIEERKAQQDQWINRYHDPINQGISNELTEILSIIESLQQKQDIGEVSDGYHTFNELYYYRILYNAAFFNLLPKNMVHKSKRHHTGEECFGGGWFIVMANLPTGQVSNHYELKDWDLFRVPEKEVADEWDGHTPQEAAKRIYEYLQQEQPFPRWIHANYSDKPEIRHSPSGDLYLQSGSYMIWLSDLETLPKDGTDSTNPGPKQLETDMKSPFTGSKVVIQSREEEVTFRGEKVKIICKYYRCVDTGREFTDGKLDDDMMWSVFRAYCEKKGMTSFTDIMLKQEQPEVDLEKALDQWRHEHFKGKRDDDYNGEYLERKSQLDLACHFWNIGYNARKEK